MKSSSESIAFDVVVRGVGGAAAASAAAEARILFLLEGLSWAGEDIVASAAFRFLVVGDMVAV
jgi:hypothetical protein